MKLLAFLPRTRGEAGALFEIDQYRRPTWGPVRCRGEADNAAAAKAANPEEDPTQPYGDHPDGTYRVSDIRDVPEEQWGTYGRWFIVLTPTGGDAIRAQQNGRTGIGIHAGRLHADGRLRETFGCLRIDPWALEELVPAIRAAWARDEAVWYECQTVRETPLAA